MTSLAASRLCRWPLSGPSSVPHCNALPKTRIGCSAVSNAFPLFNSRPDGCAARVFTGLGTGMLNAITPVWATETASHTSRGAFVSIEFTLNIFGVVVAYWIEFGTSKYSDQESSFIWRFPIAFQIVPLTFLAIVVWFMPESPVSTSTVAGEIYNSSQ